MTNPIYEFVGGNIFYGVYYVKDEGFGLGWDFAFERGKFELGRAIFADFDQSLYELLSRLPKLTEECRISYNFEKDDHRLNFRFHHGMKKKYGFSKNKK